MDRLALIVAEFTRHKNRRRVTDGLHNVMDTKSSHKPHPATQKVSSVLGTIPFTLQKMRHGPKNER